VAGCGLIGAKRVAALTADDELFGCYDVRPEAATAFAERHGCNSYATLAELLEQQPDVMLIATTHDSLAELAEHALQKGAHVLVEKPGAVSSAQIDRLIEAQRDSGLLVKVGFNHRFHPAIARVAEEVHSGAHGKLMHLRAHYGHGGRPGYEREWRAAPARSGGGELIDQGMHLLDLSNWLAGPLPLHSALLRTQFWDVPVEDNAALLLGAADSTTAPWAMLAVSWTEWKNCFSLEIYCTSAKLHVSGLARSYGAQRLRIYRMGAELGPPDVEEIAYPEEDLSWQREWEHFRAAIEARDGGGMLGDLHDARVAWTQVEAAYSCGPYADMRDALVA
jgi:predicted dehydrogenase